jgi:hypothetical protein
MTKKVGMETMEVYIGFRMLIKQGTPTCGHHSEKYFLK